MCVPFFGSILVYYKLFSTNVQITMYRYAYCICSTLEDEHSGEHKEIIYKALLIFSFYKTQKQLRQ